jgi:hypothetical protein
MFTNGSGRFLEGPGGCVVDVEEVPLLVVGPDAVDGVVDGRVVVGSAVVEW